MLPTRSAADHRQKVADRARVALLVSAAVTLALYVIPYGHLIGYPLVLVSTVVHELGHGFTALLVGGQFRELVMYSHGGGWAVTAAGSDLGHALICAGGLVGPAVASMFGFVAARRARSARIAMAAIGVVLALAEIVYVRSLFGLVFVGLLAAVCLAIAVRGRAQLSQVSLTLLSVQLALSVFSRGDYLFSKTAGGMASDVSDVELMARSLGGTYWMWGIVCGAISIACLVAGGWYLVRSGGQRKKSGNSSASGTLA